MNALVEGGGVSGGFRGAADVRAQCFEKIPVRNNAAQFLAIIDYQKMMKVHAIEYLFDDFQAVVHSDADESRSHDGAYFHAPDYTR